MIAWKLPSPTWPTIGALRPNFLISVSAKLIHSTRLEIGTPPKQPTQVDTFRQKQHHNNTKSEILRGSARQRHRANHPNGKNTVFKTTRSFFKRFILGCAVRVANEAFVITARKSSSLHHHIVIVGISASCWAWAIVARRPLCIVAVCSSATLSTYFRLQKK